jgi:uncharacterized glyoxalase superfamily protein PhnB
MGHSPATRAIGNWRHFGQGRPHLVPGRVPSTAIDIPDALHERAVAAGAETVMGLTDQEDGSREFAARDLEGNVWCFGTNGPGA